MKEVRKVYAFKFLPKGMKKLRNMAKESDGYVSAGNLVRRAVKAIYQIEL